MRRNHGVIFRGVAFAIAALGLAAAASAHEARLVGPNGEYRLVVGWRNEPAFEDVINSIDFNILRIAGNRPVNRNAGDVVDLTVEVQYRADDDFNAPVLASAPVEPLAQAFGTTNRYGAWFKPSRDGAYAFRVTGTISDASSPVAGPVTIDETFVCGGGSQGTEPFNCVADPQVFPHNGGHKDVEGYRDDD